jgi:proliferating cell nuclear antigen
MFQASISKALVLKKIIEAIRELINEVNIEVNADGLGLQAMDSSHVALVSLLLKSTEFEEFHCREDQFFSLNISNLSKVLKCADNDDRVSIQAEPNVAKLNFQFEGQRDEKVSQFKLNLVSLDNEKLGIPENEYPVVVNMRSEEFARICRELSQLSDTLMITVDKEKIQFSVEGDIGEGQITLKNRTTGKNPVVIEATESVSSSYAMRYLNLFNKASTLTEEIALSISPNLPLIVCFNFDMGYLMYYLAPKVSDEP